ncbi:Dyp-type peroxidase [Nocardia sp. XZ_19_385]|uniref:Dyp-type peroxidase n=1 Tax=Nocardia sp. XZ_19_385 TaxID=2769488 RepID=UPI00188E6CE5|nr:Dyp-type peroxidase [Nocardia sp. XZ_19_385]
MGEPQPILDPLSPSAIFLVVTIDEGGESAVRDLLEDLSGLKRSVGFRVPGSDLSIVTSIGSAAWDRLFSGSRPAALREFPGYFGPKHQAPATPGDLLFHIKSQTPDAAFELAMTIGEKLEGAGTVVDETIGFRYFEQRDLLGFVDGTENPEGPLAKSAALVGDEDPEFAGGSYVVVQKYTHDLTAWRALPVPEQERVIGRTKLEDYELSDADKPADSHVAVNTVTDPETGAERKILRANMPFGSVKEGEFGTYYIAYAASPDVTDSMLVRMFLGTEDATHDRILDFSTAITGTQFFTPSADFFEDLPEPAEAPGESAGIDVHSNGSQSNGSGSLGIGTLKRSRS